MQHPDEGLIHAWLDGALGDDEAARIDGHIRSCAACSERVAEARGLIAASSRVLGKLDDVPPAVPVPAVREGPKIVSRQPRRWVSPKMAAAAALLIVAAGTWAGFRGRDGAVSDVTPAATAFDSVAADTAPVARVEERLSAAADRRETAGVGAVSAPAPSRQGAREPDVGGNQIARSQSERVVQAAPAPAPAVAGEAEMRKQAARSEELPRLAEDRASRPGEVASEAARRAGDTGRRDRNELAARAPAASALQLVMRSMSQSEIDSVVNLFAGCYNAVRGEKAINDGFPAQISLLNRLHRRVGDQQTWVAAQGAVVPSDVTWEWTLGAAFNVALQRVSGGPILSAEFSSGSGADVVLRRIECR